MKHLFTDRDKITDGAYDESIANMMSDYRKSLTKQFGPILSEGMNLKFHVSWLMFILYVISLIGFANEELLRFQPTRSAYVTFPFLFISYLVYAYDYSSRGTQTPLSSNIEGLKMLWMWQKRRDCKSSLSYTDLFEQLLPYAIALDMEKIWGEKFEKELLSATLQPDSYHPVWYTGSYMRASMLAHLLNSTLSNTVSHAATPPQQASSGGGNWSSGSFGGGFSGMGGGGGRVGGW